MTKLVATAAAILLLTCAGGAQNTTPNFSGTWSIDIAKSDFGPAPPPDSVVMVIDHKEPSIKVMNTQKGAQGETVNERTLTTDGKESSSKLQTPAGEQDLKSTAKWSGKTLAIESAMDIQGMSIGLSDAWDLSDDGKVITIVRSIRTPQGDFGTKMVFNKK